MGTIRDRRNVRDRAISLERKCARIGRVAASFAVFLFATDSAAAQDAPHQEEALRQGHIVVGPNMLVSRDGNFPHVELMVAAHPRNRKNLVGGAITLTRPSGGFATRAYATIDGGHTWRVAEFPEQILWGGADPQVAFTPSGTALFASLAMIEDEDGRTRGGMHVYRSEDGGLTWGDAIDLHYSWDHPQMVVDHTTGRFAGRAYIGVLYGYPVYRVGVFRSDDDGRTWIGPVEAANGGGELGINVVNLGVFSDGTLFVPYVDFEFKPERRPTDEYESGFWFVTSADGGVTFSQPTRIGTQHGRVEGRLGTMPQFAVDGRSDRVYVAWTDQRSGDARIWTTNSADRGRTWSEPTMIDPGAPAEAKQFQPAVAVNDSGVVAITWFDTRSAEDGRSYRQFITASLDGGRTWLPATAVSEQAGDPRGAVNLTYQVNGWRYPADSMRIALTSAASRWGNGGDYMGLVADASGVFHPWWADSRTGTFQIMTAEVRIEPVDTAVASSPVETIEREVTTQVDVVADPTRFEDDVAVLPIRLRNVGESRIHAPLRLVIRGFGSGQGDELTEFTPDVLNASSGPGGHPTIDFTPAIGSRGVLEPGALTGAVEIRLRVKDPLTVPDLHVAIIGQVETVK